MLVSLSTMSCGVSLPGEKEEKEEMEEMEEGVVRYLPGHIPQLTVFCVCSQRALESETNHFNNLMERQIKTHIGPK